MIRASALYISLIVSILIVLVCGSMLLIGFIYKMQERKQERAQLLRENMASARLVLMQEDFKTDTIQKLSLYGAEKDSVSLEKRVWGVYKIGLAKGWINTDTIKNAFLMGSLLADSLKVLFLADEDRPMSITGKSLIRGTAYLPKSGIKAAYVESSGYEDKTLVYGQVKDSDRNLPEPDADLLKSLVALLSGEVDGGKRLPDSLRNSFFNPVKRLHLEKDDVFLSGLTAVGNVIISSDSMLVVDRDCNLDGVILVAPYVKIEDSFTGRLQVIASDSIIVGSEVKLSYPSALVVIKNDSAKYQVKISIGNKSVIEGQLFAYEKERTELMPVIQVGKGSLVKGEVWSKGYVALSKTVRVEGSVSAIRLMARVASAIYENYLIDVKLDKMALSKYYLSSGLLNKQAKSGRLLCWVN